MNIFASSSDYERAAVALDDKRLIKMVLETAQLLSSAVRYYDHSDAPDNHGLYKSTHVNHPCAIWARSCVYRYSWLSNHGMSLSHEYTRRFNKRHASHLIIQACDALWGFGTFVICDRDDLDFPNCAKNSSLNLDFTHLPVHDAYQAYLNARWATDRRQPTWTNSEPPSWKLNEQKSTSNA